jgi:hypothetical protein
METFGSRRKPKECTLLGAQLSGPVWVEGHAVRRAPVALRLRAESQRGEPSWQSEGDSNSQFSSLNKLPNLSERSTQPITSPP